MKKKQVDEEATVIIKFFSLKTDNPDEFVDRLEQLCKKFCFDKNFYFKYSVEGQKLCDVIVQ